MGLAGKWKMHEQAKLRCGDTTFGLQLTTNWKMALFLSTSNANTLSVGTGVYGDITNEVANAFGYTTGGIALTGVSWANSAGTETFTCTSPVWTAAGGSITARFAYIYQNATLNAIVKPLLCVCLLDATPADVTATDTNTLTVTINVGGVVTLSGAAVD